MGRLLFGSKLSISGFIAGFAGRGGADGRKKSFRFTFLEPKNTDQLGKQVFGSGKQSKRMESELFRFDLLKALSFYCLIYLKD